MVRLFFRLGDAGKILLVMISGLFLLSLSRVGLALWQWQRVVESGIGPDIFSQGLRADLIIVFMLMSPAVLLFPLSGIKILRPVWQKLFLLWTVFILTLLLFMELATPAFLMQYDVRPNRLFIEYLSYPKEVISMLWNGFRLSVLASIAGTTLFVVFLFLPLFLFPFTERQQIALNLAFAGCYGFSWCSLNFGAQAGEPSFFCAYP